MGLAASQARLLTLTARKADCEFNISMGSMKRMSLSREQSALSQKYYSLLQQKELSYYHNGQYNPLNYNYLMGGGSYSSIISGNQPLKDDNSMILSDFKGQVVMSDKYASAITSVLGSGAMDGSGRGKTFSVSPIPEILAKLVPGQSAEDFKAIIDGNEEAISSSYEAENQNMITGESTGTTTTVDNSAAKRDLLQKLVDFYYPIFSAAAANGWTSEYNKDMALNDDYVNDALMSGTFQLVSVNDEGNYEPDKSLTYFVTSGAVQSRTSSEAREEVTAWYNAEKERLTEKENFLDIDMDNWSMELEAINTEIQAVQSLIDDAISSVFDWGNG